MSISSADSAVWQSIRHLRLVRTENLVHPILDFGRCELWAQFSVADHSGCDADVFCRPHQAASSMIALTGDYVSDAL